MAAVWLVKRWHRGVEADGRVMIRVDGRRYAFQAVRVEGPETGGRLKDEPESRAERFLTAALPPRTQPEGEIWFFRLVPRPANDE